MMFASTAPTGSSPPWLPQHGRVPAAAACSSAQQEQGLQHNLSEPQQREHMTLAPHFSGQQHQQQQQQQQQPQGSRPFSGHQQQQQEGSHFGGQQQQQQQQPQWGPPFGGQQQQQQQQQQLQGQHRVSMPAAGRNYSISHAAQVRIDASRERSTTAGVPGVPLAEAPTEVAGSSIPLPPREIGRSMPSSKAYHNINQARTSIVNPI